MAKILYGLVFTDKKEPVKTEAKEIKEQVKKTTKKNTKDE